MLAQLERPEGTENHNITRLPARLTVVESVSRWVPDRGDLRHRKNWGGSDRGPICLL